MPESTITNQNLTAFVAGRVCRRHAEGMLEVHPQGDYVERTDKRGAPTITYRPMPAPSAFVHAHRSPNGMFRVSARAPGAFQGTWGPAQDSAEVLAFLRSLQNQPLPECEANLRPQRAFWQPHTVAGSPFTDPAQHDPAQFRYLVKAVTRQGNWERFLRDPRDGISRQIISASVIDQDHRATFSDTGGYILKAPADAFWAADTSDMGFPSDVIERHPEDVRARLETYAGLYGLRTPAELLAQTDPRDHNEVVLTGTTYHGVPVEIAAVFVFEHTLHLPMARDLLDSALWLGKGVVVLPPPSPP